MTEKRVEGDLSAEQLAARMAITQRDLQEAVYALRVRAERAKNDPQLDEAAMNGAAIRIGAAYLAGEPQ